MVHWKLRVVMMSALSSLVTPHGVVVTTMTSSNGNVSALLVICVGNSPVTGEFPSNRPVTRSFDVFFGLRLKNRLRKQSWGWWLETPSRSLWRHSNVTKSWHHDNSPFSMYHSIVASISIDIMNSRNCTFLTLPTVNISVYGIGI